MKTRNRLLVGAGLALLGAAACNNDKLTNLNKNPNSPEDVPANSIFTQASRTAVSRWLGAGSPDLRGTEWVAQQLAEVQYPDEDDYKRLQGGQTAGNFDNAYQGELEDLNKVIQKGIAAKEPGLYAPAQILRSWVFGNLTDMFGDVPYFQALKGDTAGGSLTPAYDAQKAIYTDLFKVLDQASKDLATASNVIGAADPIYGGDPAAWQKFANSLRLRLAMRVVNVDQALASAQIAAALAAPGGLLTSNADNTQLNWPGDGVYNNPWADNFSGRDDHRMSQTLMNIMTATNDPRTGIYAMPTVDWQNGVAGAAKYAGMPNGLTQATASKYFTSTSRPGAVFYPGVTVYGTYGGTGKSWPSFLMTYADVQFIEAEAAARSLGGLAPAQAAAFYTNGIEASMAQWGVTDAAAIAAFLAQPNVAYAGGVQGQTQIATQRWLALYSDGLNAWSEWRRTCVPNTVIPGPYAIINTVPRRFEYSITEYSVNGAAVAAAATQMGGPDNFTTRFWWDSKPSNAPTLTAGCGTRP